MENSFRQKLADYKMPREAIELINGTRIVFLVGISGAGKNTVLRKLINAGEYQYIVSHTTRKPRYNKGIPEKDGTDYHFIDTVAAERMLDKKEFVEAKIYGKNIYGTSIAEIKRARDNNKIAITDVEVQGIAEYKAAAPRVLAVFLLPPDFETWQERLLKRYKGSVPDPQDLKRRMQTAKSELREALDKDYFEFVINDDLARTVGAVDDIVHGETSKLKNEEARKLAKELLPKL